MRQFVCHPEYRGNVVEGRKKARTTGGPRDGIEDGFPFYRDSISSGSKYLVSCLQAGHFLGGSVPSWT